MEYLQQALQKNPGLVEQWRKEGEKRYAKYLQRKSLHRDGRGGGEIIIPIVFHLVDDASKLSWITDRDIYEQVEILNQAYNGLKADKYQNVIPPEMYALIGRVPIKFVLARRKPDGSITSGIERRVHTTPDRKAVKSNATGGLDVWDENTYLNVWAGTFSGDDDGLLGVATFPFTTTEGPQGVVISIASLPYTSNVSRSYYPAYAEGATLAHEIGHYFYLWHTFGDSYACNNTDFRIQGGWPLPTGAGPEGDDTPAEKADAEGNAHYGNPSGVYSDGCSTESWGELYSSFMNYFDDRAMFIFTKGHQKRVMGCLDLYRPGLINSQGAIPPVPVTDAYVVNISPRGIPERRENILNNTPLSVTLRNYGNTNLNTLTLTALLDGTEFKNELVNLNLAPGKDSTFDFGIISGAGGTHALTIFSSLPNGLADAFPQNDSIESFIYINTQTVAAPFGEDFSSSTFPPSGWHIWDPNDNITWTYNATAGFGAAGSATIQNYNYNGAGQLDEIVAPAIDMGGADSSLLTFRVAYAPYDVLDVSLWDGLEVYVSNDRGKSYHLVYKKSGTELSTISQPLTSSFIALPANPEKWKLQSVNLTSYLVEGEKILLKFRGVNAHGNNLYLDDIHVSARVSLNRDTRAMHIQNIPEYLCESLPAPTLTFKNEGKDMLTSLKINYKINEGAIKSMNWTGNLPQGDTSFFQFQTLSSLAAGAYEITLFTSEPNGAADEYLQNDTLKTSFYVFDKQNSPVFEGFETVNFPPSPWVLQKSNPLRSWQRTTEASDSGIGSMFIQNFDYNLSGEKNNFISPVITGNTGYDSLFVSFDYAYAQGRNYPGNFGDPEDSLEVQLSLDCGQTFITIWKEGGFDMTTALNPAGASERSYKPTSQEWKHIKIPVGPITGDLDFQVFLRSKSNHRNNLYLDNINIYGVVVPPVLKERGYLFYPSPFHNQLQIRNYEQPVNLKSVQIYNATGQLVWQQHFQGDANKIIYADLSNTARGVYMVKLTYTDKTIVDRVIKQ